MQSALCRPQSLILSPTRELAGQTTKTIQAMGEFMKVRAHTCVGGTNLGEPESLQAPLRSPLSLLVLCLLSIDKATDLCLHQGVTDIIELCRNFAWHGTEAAAVVGLQSTRA